MKPFKSPFPGKHYKKTAQEYIDYDYAQQLDASEQQWLAKFTDEYYHGSVGKNDASALHSADTLRHAAYANNNANNRDLYAVSLVNGFLNEAAFASDDSLKGIRGDIANEEENRSVRRIDGLRKLQEDIKVLEKKLAKKKAMLKELMLYDND